MALKIKLHEAIGVGDLEVELQRLVPGLSDDDAHDFAKEILVAAKRTHSNSKAAGPSVKIGTQTWTATNLSVDDGGEGIYKNPNNNETYYTWDAAMRVAKSIPGWHLPSALEWNEAALACGATEKPYKEGSNPNLNDYEDAQELKDKLGVKLVGLWVDGSFNDLGGYANFWTATQYSSTDAYYRYFSTGALMDSNLNDKTYYAYSVRLVKD